MKKIITGFAALALVVGVSSINSAEAATCKAGTKTFTIGSKKLSTDKRTGKKITKYVVMSSKTKGGCSLSTTCKVGTKTYKFGSSAGAGKIVVPSTTKPGACSSAKAPAASPSAKSPVRPAARPSAKSPTYKCAANKCSNKGKCYTVGSTYKRKFISRVSTVNPQCTSVATRAMAMATIPSSVAPPARAVPAAAPAAAPVAQGSWRSNPKAAAIVKADEAEFARASGGAVSRSAVEQALTASKSYNDCVVKLGGPNGMDGVIYGTVAPGSESSAINSICSQAFPNG